MSQGELNMTKEQFTDRFGDEPRRDSLLVLVCKQDDPTDQVAELLCLRAGCPGVALLPEVSVSCVQIFVFFPEELKIGVTTIKEYFNRMKDEGVNRAIMVMPGVLTSFAKTSLQDISSKYLIEQVSPSLQLPGAICLSESPKGLRWPPSCPVQGVRATGQHHPACARPRAPALVSRGEACTPQPVQGRNPFIWCPPSSHLLLYLLLCLFLSPLGGNLNASAPRLFCPQVSDTQLPRIQMADPVARYYGLQRGQVRSEPDTNPVPSHIIPPYQPLILTLAWCGYGV